MADTGSDERTAIEHAIRAYTAAFARGDAAGAARWCAAPFLSVTTEGAMLAATPEETERAYAAVLAALRARGFAHTEFVELQVATLGPGLAIASGRAVRRAASGAELEQIGATYLLRRVEGEWRIVVVASHPPEAVLRALGQ